MKLKHQNKKFIGISIIYIHAYTYTCVHNTHARVYIILLPWQEKRTNRNICKGVGNWEAQGIVITFLWVLVDTRNGGGVGLERQR